MKPNYSHAADPPAPCRSPRAPAFLMAALLTLSAFALDAAPQVPSEGKYPFVDKIPQAIFRVTPDYPPQAYLARIEGTVVIQALIDAAGKPESLVVVKSIPELDGAALGAIRQWRFSPAMREDTPVPVWVSIPVPFSISSTTAPSGKVVTVEVTVSEASPAMVWATIVDRNGRRCGGTPDHPLGEIPGCVCELQWEQGTPSEPTTEGGADSAAKRSEDTPDGIGFTIRDSTAEFGLVREGGCQLQLTSVGNGLVSLSVIAEGTGLSDGKDTTSVVVRGKRPTRLWLSWRVDGKKCVAKISRTSPGTPKSP